MKPKLEQPIGAAFNQERYNYGQHLQYNGTCAYGGPGSLAQRDNIFRVKLSIDDNINHKIELSLKKERSQDLGVTYETVTLNKGASIGLLLALTYDDNYQYIKITSSSGGYINDLEDGPKLEIIN